jgi:Mlc titration factor MtfA (ptsG expression regulator)
MNYFFLLQDSGIGYGLVVFFSVLLIVVLLMYFSYHMVETLYVMKYNRPLYGNFIFHLKELPSQQLEILKTNFLFYNKLDDKHKGYFEHRVASFISDKRFIGRKGVVITDEIKVLVSATACMLTFGFRNFHIGLIDRIFIYPNEFYSTINDEYHKGEFNPKLGALVLSWKDFKEGNEDEKDHVNLGIHEFTHAIHLNCLEKRDVSSLIFRSTFNELIRIISDKEQGDKLIESHFLRNYAFTNKFEFLAVTIESFIETPKEFKSKFPKIYSKVKQMLNFNFAEY